MPGSTSTAGSRLKRVIGTPALVLTIVNFTIGSGIFVLPALVGIQLGSYSLFAYLFCGIMMAAIMLCYAETGTRITNTGGSYAYVQTAFGNFAGFITNWLFFFGYAVLGDAALMNIVGDSLAVMFPVFSKFWIRVLLFLVLVGFMAFVNIRGAKQGIRFVSVLTVAKLLPLIGIIIFGFSHFQGTNLSWNHLPSLATFGSMTLVLFFAFAGFETALNVSGEIKNPKRTIPVAILAGGTTIIIFYLLIQMITLGVLGSQLEALKDAPLAAVAEKIIGPAGQIVLLIAAALSCFSNVMGDVLSSPRLLYAGAQDDLFPKFMKKVHPKFFTPYWAIIVYAGLIFLFSSVGNFKQLALLSSTCILIIYLSVILATIKLRKRNTGRSGDAFRVPGGLIIPMIGIATILWLLTSLSKKEILTTLIFIVVISALYFIVKKSGKTEEAKIFVAEEFE